MNESHDSQTPLIPRSVFFGNADHSQVRISPDATRVSWLAPADGIMNVWVAPRSDLAAGHPVTSDTSRGIRIYFWAFTNAHILYLQDKNGDENWRLHAVDLTTGVDRDLTPFDGVQARIAGISELVPTDLVVAVNNRDPKWHDFYRLDIGTGEMSLLFRNERFVDISVNNQLELAIATEMTSDGGAKFHRFSGGELHQWSDVSPDDALTTAVVGFNQMGNSVLMKDSRGRNTSALLSIDLATDQVRVLAQDAKVDAADVLVHPVTHEAQAVSFVHGRRRWQILDETIGADLQHLQTLAEGEVLIASRSQDDLTWIVAYLVDNGPMAYCLYDRTLGRVNLLFTNRRDLENLQLARMRPVIITSRDSLEMVGYYTLPLGSDINDDGIPDHPLPMVFIPHGGPWHRDHWGYSSQHQWLANRGYAVLSVNFRASTGFGKDFINAGDREWGGRILDDQVDAVQWAIRAGVADSSRVAILGGSFGGFSTLAGLTFTPELFACGVDLVGVANLMTWITSIPAYWKPMLDMLIKRVGDPSTEAGRAMLIKHSPLTYVDRICRPLLIAQGANDPRVRQAESDQIAESMKSRGIPVTYLLYPDEGHGFARPENNLSFYAVTEAFLAKCLGGRCEKIGSELQGSSITVLAGASEVVGLTEALAGQ